MDREGTQEQFKKIGQQMEDDLKKLEARIKPKLYKDFASDTDGDGAMDYISATIDGDGRIMLLMSNRVLFPPEPLAFDRTVITLTPQKIREIVVHLIQLADEVEGKA